jgi:hypothetical protein
MVVTITEQQVGGSVTATRSGQPLPRRCAGAAVVATSVLAGSCSAPGASLESSPEVAVTSVDARLHDPVWSYRQHTLVALTDEDRLAEISSPAGPARTRTLLSSPLAAGRNVQISAKDDGQVFVPQPKHGTVAVVELAGLRTVTAFDAGPAPAYLSEDAGERVLLALSADGTSVTPVEQYGFAKLPRATITGQPADRIDGAHRGRAIEYHLYDSSGVRYYKGPPSPPEERGSFATGVSAAAGDRAKATRSYLAPRDQNTVYALDSHRSDEGLEVVGRAELASSPIRYLGSDDTRLYAATDRDLAVLETASFTGYRHGTIPIIRTIDYRNGLSDKGLQSVPLSGMAIGPDRVYLTLAGQTRLVSVAKPHL